MFVSCFCHLPVFFLNQELPKCSYFFHFFNIFLEKSEMLMSKIFKKKTGKCQKHATNIISRLFHASDIYLFFLLNQKLPKCSLLFHFINIFLEKGEVFMSQIFKTKTGKCQYHATNIISCLFHAYDIYQFFFNQKFPKCSLFF